MLNVECKTKRQAEEQRAKQKLGKTDRKSDKKETEKLMFRWEEVKTMDSLLPLLAGIIEYKTILILSIV